ncbi:epidermal growth factor-like protein 7 [Anopheles cruzii]|uniref:epidermal growth factor-like protein 7 n=1 Tax=Anopheles cruzii TaxID=68878 RepID=UPI0022EC2C75|nr:epidermal growth factor-like protein 7 [Anopheles cruzii]
MSRELSRHLVAVAIVLTLCCESVSRALQDSATEADAGHHYQQQQHQRKHHHHQRHRAQSDRRNQTSLGHSASYALISGPASVNRGNDYGVRSLIEPHFHHHHQQQPQRPGHGSRQDTPPQHRRHSRGGQHHHQPAGGTIPNGWGRTLVQESETKRSPTGGSASSRPVNRMLTRSVISSGGSRGLNSTSKNVCTVYVYRKSLVKTPFQPCTDLASCSGMRIYSYPMAKREVCCRGWESATTVSEGCFKPVCQTNCRNGGQCTAPDRCSCPKGFTGALCELDVNECKEHKPCDQTCYNTEGSFYCACREGFMLHSDRQSCRKIDETNDIATEARDMENDVDYDSLDTRLTKLEQMISREERRSFGEKQELNKKVQYAMDAVSVLKSQVARLTQRIYPSTEYGKRPR